MPIEIVDSDIVREKVQQVKQNPGSFVLLGFEPNSHNRLKLFAFEQDATWEDLTESLLDGRVLFGLANLKISELNRLIFLAWCGPNVMGLKLGLFPNYTEQIGESIFEGFSFKYIARREEDLSFSALSKFGAGPQGEVILSPSPSPNPMRLRTHLEQARSSIVEIHHAEPEKLPLRIENYNMVRVMREKVKKSNLLELAAKTSAKPEEKDNNSLQEKDNNSLQEKDNNSLQEKKVDKNNNNNNNTEYQKVITVETVEKIEKVAENIELIAPSSSSPSLSKSPAISSSMMELSARFPNLQKQQIEYAMTLFKKHDKDKNGVLDKEEFKQFEHELLQSEVSSHLIDRIARRNFDTVSQGKQTITKDDFLMFYDDLFGEERSQVADILQESTPDIPKSQISEALKLFEKHDLDGNGFLDKEEFYQLKEELNPELSKLVVRYLVDQSYLKLQMEEKREGLSREEFLKHYQELLRQSISNSALAVQNSDVSSKHWQDFVNADDVEAIVHRYQELLEVCGGAEKTGLARYHAIRDSVACADVNSNVLWKLLDFQLKQPSHHSKPVQEKVRAVIIGAGPAGLRSALELALFGANVTLTEKRRSFSRNNHLHLWPSAIRDLRNLGAKFFYGSFCTGGVEHVSIRRIQAILLKVCLLMGVKFERGVTFEDIEDPVGEKGYWHALYKTREKTEIRYPCNVLFGCDGENSAAAEVLGFTHKIFKGGTAIGLTCNFVNGKTPEEKQLRELPGLLRVYHQQFFKDLKEKAKADLENIVYYREDTHYFVMTATRDSLLQAGVIKSNDDDAKRLLRPDNISQPALEQFCRSIATVVGIPPTVPFMTDKRGKKDVAIFDFSKKKATLLPGKIYQTERTTAENLFVALIGDSLIEPFWPQGTGLNRCILGALDTIFYMKKFFENPTVDPQDLLSEWSKYYKIMNNAGADDLVENFSKHSLDPKSRYKDQGLGRFH